MFMHVNDFDGSAMLLCEGQRVRFDIVNDRRTGKPKAENVQLL